SHRFKLSVCEMSRGFILASFVTRTRQDESSLHTKCDIRHILGFEIRKESNVRFGSKADICSAIRDVRFTPESRHVRCNQRCPLWAKSGHGTMVPKEFELQW